MITFDGVHFSYAENRVLTDLTLAIGAGADGLAAPPELCAGAAGAFAAAAGAGEAEAPSVSRVNNTDSIGTMSPSFTFNSITVPAIGLGTSTVALSVINSTTG